MAGRKKQIPAKSEELRAIEKLVAKIGRPVSVRKVEVELGEDSTGSPAIWIVLSVDEDLKPAQNKLDELTAFGRQITSKILDSSSNRWPYVRLRTSA